MVCGRCVGADVGGVVVISRVEFVCMCCCVLCCVVVVVLGCRVLSCVLYCCWVLLS